MQQFQLYTVVQDKAAKDWIQTRYDDDEEQTCNDCFDTEESCFCLAASRGDTAAMRRLLSKTADPAGMLYGKPFPGLLYWMLRDGGWRLEVQVGGWRPGNMIRVGGAWVRGADRLATRHSFPIVEAARGGHVDAVRLLLDHPHADAHTMLRQKCSGGYTALLAAAEGGGDVNRELCTCQAPSTCGHTDVMRVLLSHPSCPAAMQLADRVRHQEDYCGVGPADENVLMLAANSGHTAVIKLVLEHPAADVGRLLSHVDATGCDNHTALSYAALFATDGEWAAPSGHASCAPLLLLLRHDASQQLFRLGTEEAKTAAHNVMESMEALLCVDNPVDGRDECVRLLLERGAPLSRQEGLPLSPVMVRVIRELVRERAELVRTPHLIQEAIVGLAFTRRGGGA